MNKVLVIEDDPAVRANILDLLEAEGFAGCGASDGPEGIQLAVAQRPDLVICDVTMPGIDGFQVFEALSAQPSTASLPFIFLSARAERDDVRRGMALGADDYLTKPFTRRELLDTIRVRLKRTRASDSLSPPANPRAASGSNTLVLADPAMTALMAQLEHRMA